jgi:hypothetical protein
MNMKEQGPRICGISIGWLLKWADVFDPLILLN